MSLSAPSLTLKQLKLVLSGCYICLNFLHLCSFCKIVMKFSDQIYQIYESSAPYSCFCQTLYFTLYSFTTIHSGQKQVNKIIQIQLKCYNRPTLYYICFPLMKYLSSAFTLPCSYLYLNY